jgi:hypothetical protein
MVIKLLFYHYLLSGTIVCRVSEILRRPCRCVLHYHVTSLNSLVSGGQCRLGVRPETKLISKRS